MSDTLGRKQELPPPFLGRIWVLAGQIGTAGFERVMTGGEGSRGRDNRERSGARNCGQWGRRRAASPPLIRSTVLGRVHRASSFGYRREGQRLGGYSRPPRPVKSTYTSVIRRQDSCCAGWRGSNGLSRRRPGSDHTADRVRRLREGSDRPRRRGIRGRSA